MFSHSGKLQEIGRQFSMQWLVTVVLVTDKQNIVRGNPWKNVFFLAANKLIMFLFRMNTNDCNCLVSRWFQLEHSDNSAVGLVRSVRKWQFIGSTRLARYKVDTIVKIKRPT